MRFAKVDEAPEAGGAFVVLAADRARWFAAALGATVGALRAEAVVGLAPAGIHHPVAAPLRAPERSTLSRADVGACIAPPVRALFIEGAHPAGLYETREHAGATPAARREARESLDEPRHRGPIGRGPEARRR